MERVLVTGASTTIGRRVVARLAARPDVRTIVTADVRRDVVERVGGIDTTAHTVAALLDDSAPDTVVHAALTAGRSGDAAAGVDVIATQQLTAAISGRTSPVRTVVAVASSDVYEPHGAAPIWRREDEILAPDPLRAPGLLLEAEDYLRDLAEHQPHISVAVLRLADLTGTGATGTLAALWRHRVVPYLPGFDPAVQLLDIDDAARAVEHAAALELAGTLNVAAPGTVTWRATARLAGRPVWPALVAPGWWQRPAAAIGVPAVATDVAPLLRFGRCLDTAAITATGFVPLRTSEECVATGR